MARIRTVKPEFWQHPKVTRVSRDARLLFLGLLNEADDEGKLRYSSKRLAGVLFGEDVDVSPAKFGRWVDELEDVGLVLRYEVGGAPLLIVLGFTEHQSINRPSASRLPDPSSDVHGGIREDSLGEGNREQGSPATPGAYENDFADWYEQYPRHIERAKALAAYRARRREGIAPERLIAARDEYARVAEPGFVKYPASFLAKDVWSEWEHGPPSGAMLPPAVPKLNGNFSSEPARAVLGRGVDALPVWELDEHGEAVAR